MSDVRPLVRPGGVIRNIDETADVLIARDIEPSTTTDAVNRDMNIGTAFTAGKKIILGTATTEVQIPGMVTIVDLRVGLSGPGSLTIGDGDGDTITLGGAWTTNPDTINLGTYNADAAKRTVLNLNVNMLGGLNAGVSLDRTAGGGAFLVLPDTANAPTGGALAGMIRVTAAGSLDWYTGAAWVGALSTAPTLQSVLSAGSTASIATDFEIDLLRDELAGLVTSRELVKNAGAGATTGDISFAKKSIVVESINDTGSGVPGKIALTLRAQNTAGYGGESYFEIEAFDGLVDHTVLSAGFQGSGNTFVGLAADIITFQNMHMPIARDIADASNTDFLTSNKTFIGAINELASGGVVRKSAVINYVDCTVAPPTEILNDRYILDFTAGTVHASWDGASKGDIVQFNGTLWIAETPLEGWVAYVDSENQDRLYVDDGAPDWEPRPTAVIIAGAGTLSSVRAGATCTAGDYSFSVGQSSAALGTHNAVFGETSAIDASSHRNLVAGSGHSLAAVGSSGVSGVLVSGSGQYLRGNLYNSVVLGGSHLVTAQDENASLSSNFIAGNNHYLLAWAGAFVQNNSIVGTGHRLHEISTTAVTGGANRVRSAQHSHIGGSNNKLATANSSAVFGYSIRAGLFNSGTGISLVKVGSTITVTDYAGLFRVEHNNTAIYIQGTLNNNGSYLVTYIDANQVSYTNAGGATEAGTDFTMWSLEGNYLQHALAGGSSLNLPSLNSTIMWGQNMGPYDANARMSYTHTNSAIFGEGLRYRAAWDYSLVAGYAHNLANIQYSTVMGSNHTANSALGAMYCSHLFGESQTVDNVRYSIVGGQSNNVSDTNHSLVVAQGCTLKIQHSGIFGSSHNIQGTSYQNLIAGYYHTTSGNNQISNSGVFGNSHQLAMANSNDCNLVSGYGNKLHSEVYHSSIAGQGNYVRGWWNAIAGYSNRNQGNYNAISGSTNNLGENASKTLVSGDYNKLSPGNMGDSISFAFDSGTNTVTVTDTDGLFLPEMQGMNIFVRSNGSGLTGVHNNITYIDEYTITFWDSSASTYGGSIENIWFIYGSSDYTSVSGSQNAVYKSSAAAINGTNNVVIDSDNALIHGISNEMTASPCSHLTGRKGKLVGAEGIKIHSVGHPADGYSGVAGEGQIIESMPYSGKTDGTTPAILTTGPGGLTFQSTAYHAYVLQTLVIAKCVAGPSVGGVKSWRLTTTYDNDGTILSIIGSPLIEPLSESSEGDEAQWDIVPGVYVSTNFQFEAFGSENDTIWWQCHTMGPQVGDSTGGV
jgi:hypothetical protein